MFNYYNNSEFKTTNYSHKSPKLSSQEVPFKFNHRPPPWIYIGWICHKTDYSYISGHITFESLVEQAQKSDHGEERAVDIYKEGAVCWVKDKESI